MWGMLAIQWIHVLLALFWFGGILYLNAVVVPVLLKLPPAEQRPISAALGQASSRIFMPVQVLVIVFGILRGTVWGPIDSVAALTSTSYGITFLVSLLATIGLAGFGHAVSGKAAQKLGTFPLEEIVKPGSPVAAAYLAQVQRVKLFIGIQLIGFIVIFTLMIFLRFGI